MRFPSFLKINQSHSGNTEILPWLEDKCKELWWSYHIISNTHTHSCARTHTYRGFFKDYNPKNNCTGLGYQYWDRHLKSVLFSLLHILLETIRMLFSFSDSLSMDDCVGLKLHWFILNTLSKCFTITSSICYSFCSTWKASWLRCSLYCVPNHEKHPHCRRVTLNFNHEMINLNVV